MFPPNQYELLDFGGGRKLERVGSLVLDRPSPPAEGQSRIHRELWDHADAKFVRHGPAQGSWEVTAEVPENWTTTDGRITLDLKLTEFGHIGLFPEQASNWDWIIDQVRRCARPLKVLNLFAYTGGSTLAAAWAGAEVVHVDSAKTTVSRARRNAERSGLSRAPVRWIVEDASKFVRRELRRKKQYDAVVLDPPSYGHGPQDQSWKLVRDLIPLLEDCGRLTSVKRAFVLLTCHSTGVDAADIEASLADAIFGSCQAGARAEQLCLETADGRKLHSGIVARWPS